MSGLLFDCAGNTQESPSKEYSKEKSEPLPAFPELVMIWVIYEIAGRFADKIPE